MPVCRQYEGNQTAELRSRRTEPRLLSLVPKHVTELTNLARDTQAHTLCAMGAVVYGFRNIPDIAKEDCVVWCRQTADRATPWLDAEFTATLLDLAMWAGAPDLAPVYYHLLRLSVAAAQKNSRSMRTCQETRRVYEAAVTLLLMDSSAETERLLVEMGGEDALWGMQHGGKELSRARRALREMQTPPRGLGPACGEELADGEEEGPRSVCDSGYSPGGMSVLRALKLALRPSVKGRREGEEARCCICRDEIEWEWSDEAGKYQLWGVVQERDGWAHRRCSELTEG